MPRTVALVVTLNLLLAAAVDAQPGCGHGITRSRRWRVNVGTHSSIRNLSEADWNLVAVVLRFDRFLDFPRPVFECRLKQPIHFVRGKPRGIIFPN